MPEYDLGTARGRVVIDFDDKGTTKAKDAVEDVGKSTNKLGDHQQAVNNLKGQLGGVAVAGLAVTAAVAGAGAAIFAMGMGRATAIENAQAKMKGLGFTAEEVTGIMDNALTAVKGTAYGLDEAATLAATAVAAGIKPGEGLARQLSLVTNAAAASGVSMGEMGDIMRKVWTAGAVSTDQLDQLAGRGIPIWTDLAEAYGVSGDELRAMVNDGKVDMEGFTSVLEGSVGAVAKEMGGTFTGSAANAKAAISRLGAVAAAELLPYLTKAAEKVIELADRFSKDFGPQIKAVAALIGEKLVIAMEWLVDAIDKTLDFLGKAYQFYKDNADIINTYAVMIGTLIAAYKIWTAVTKAMAIAQAILNVVLTANPIGIIIVAIAAVVAALIYFFTQTETGRMVWSTFIDWLVIAWTAVSEFFVSLWETISTSVMTAWNAISEFFVNLWTTISDIFTNTWNSIVDFLTPIFEFIGNMISTNVTIWRNIFVVMAAIFVTIWRTMAATFEIVWNAIVAFITPIIEWIKSFIGDRITALKLVWTTIWDAVSAAFMKVWNGIKSFLAPIIQWLKDQITSKIEAVKATWEIIWNAISTFFKNIWQTMKDDVEEKVGLVVGIVTGIKDKVMAVFTSVKTWLLDTGKDLVRGMWDGITGMGTWLKNKVTGFFGDVVGWAEGVLGIGSPSKVFAMIGDYTIQGLVKGLERTAPKAEASITTLGSSMSDAMNTSVKSVSAANAAAPATSIDSVVSKMDPADIQKLIDGMLAGARDVTDARLEEIASLMRTYSRMEEVSA